MFTGGHIFPDPTKLHFVWGRSQATLRQIRPDDPSDHRHYSKPLAKVRRAGWKLGRVLIIDDSPEKCRQNFGNAIYPRPFEGSADDAELPLLGRYLATLKDRIDVRRIEKRGWWNNLP